MTTLEDLLREVGALYIENRMLQRQLAEKQHLENAPQTQEQKEKDEQVSTLPARE